MNASTGKTAMAFSAVLLAALVALTVVSALAIQRAGRQDIERLRAGHLEQVRKELKGYVDTAYAVVETNHRKSTSGEYLAERFGHRLRNVVDVSESVLERHLARARTGAATLEESQAGALAELRKLRYDGGTGYLQVTSAGLPYPTMLMHPIFPEREGRILDDERYASAFGRRKNLFQAGVELALADGEGFVDYLSSKPTAEGVIPGVPKLSYVRLFEPWGWVISTGIYLDDAVRETVEETRQVIASMRYDSGVGYFWVNDTSKPYPRMVMHPIRPDLDGTTLDGREFETAVDGTVNLFVAAVEGVERAGSAYVDYRWPKPTDKGVTEYVPKLSYVRLFEPLGWVIGSGAYVDDIERQVAVLEAGLERRVRDLVSSCVLALLGVMLVSGLVLAYVRHRHSRPPEAAGGERAGARTPPVAEADEVPGEQPAAAHRPAHGEAALVSTIEAIVGAALAEQTTRATLDRVIDEVRQHAPAGRDLEDRVDQVERVVADVRKTLRRLEAAREEPAEAPPVVSSAA